MSANRIISYWGLASGDFKLFKRGLQFRTPTGWRGFVDKFIKPQRDKGVSRFLFWMPFGQELDVRKQTVGAESFDSRVRFDQYLQCLKDPDLRDVSEGFAEAIRPLVDDGCQVIAYTGTLGGAPEYARLRWDREAWIERCLAPFKAANCDLAVDTACRSAAPDAVTKLARDVRVFSAAKFYCESMPRQDAPQWVHGDVFSVEEQYQNALNPNYRHLLCDPAKITGELIRSFTSANTWLNKDYFDPRLNKMRWSEWYLAKVPAVLAAPNNHSVCLHLRAFFEDGHELKELLG